MAEIKYDSEADVLHVFVEGGRNDAYGESLEGYESFVVIMRHVASDEVIGFQLLNVGENLRRLKEADDGEA